MPILLIIHNGFPPFGVPSPSQHHMSISIPKHVKGPQQYMFHTHLASKWERLLRLSRCHRWQLVLKSHFPVCVLLSVSCCEVRLLTELSSVLSRLLICLVHRFDTSPLFYFIWIIIIIMSSNFLWRETDSWKHLPGVLSSVLTPCY